MNEISFGAIDSINDKRTITGEMLDKSSTLPPNEYKIDLNYFHTNTLSNQRQLGICTACAVRIACESSYAIARAVELGYRQSFKIDDAWLYLMGKVLVDGNLWEGSSAFTMLKASNKYGCPNVLDTRYFPLKLDATYAQFIADFNSTYGGRIPREILESAKKYKIGGYYKINVNSIEIAKAVSNDKLVISRFVVGDNTYKDINGNVTWDNKKLSPLRRPKIVDGGHLWCIKAYKGLDENQIGTLVNSWSENWADEGCIDFNLKEQSGLFTEAWVIDDIPLSVIEEARKNDFRIDLKLGMNHPDVKKLQIWLNKNGYTISASGAGSAGNETSFYGNLTRQAVIKLQKMNKIVPAVGYFGKVTRGYINSI